MLIIVLLLFRIDVCFVMLSFSDNNQADVIEAFKPTSLYLDYLLNIDNPF